MTKRTSIYDRALRRFMPFVMILMVAITDSILVGTIMFVLCYAQLVLQEMNRDEEEAIDRVKTMAKEQP
jgi:hypothetical protein